MIVNITEGDNMSLTPDPYFNGDNNCTACEKPMHINDTGIIFRPSKMGDFMFCIDCATKITMSVAQDISKIAYGDPDRAFKYYLNFISTPRAKALSLRRHSNALKLLTKQMDDQADAFDLIENIEKMK
jgi:hypothetical protein